MLTCQASTGHYLDTCAQQFIPISSNLVFPDLISWTKNTEATDTVFPFPKVANKIELLHFSYCCDAQTRTSNMCVSNAVVANGVNLNVQIVRQPRKPPQD